MCGLSNSCPLFSWNYIQRRVLALPLILLLSEGEAVQRQGKSLKDSLPAGGVFPYQGHPGTLVTVVGFQDYPFLWSMRSALR